MSDLIFLGAEFNSYQKFKAAFDQYCKENAINGVPLHFLRQSITKLKPDTFKSQTIDQDTISRFVYHGQSFTCEYHRANDHRTHKTGLYCNGRVTIRYDRLKNVLRITVFDDRHENHLAHIGTTHDNVNQLENETIQRIVELLKRMPDDVLTIVEQASKRLMALWDADNDGINIHIVPVEKSNGGGEIEMPVPFACNSNSLSLTFVKIYLNQEFP